MRVKEDPWLVRESDFPVNGGPADKLRFLLSYAVLAPSSYNTQPWLFRLRGDALDLIADRCRGLPVVDPNDRELTISCGAALEFLCAALRYFGNEPDVAAFPDAGARDVLARVRVGRRTAAGSEARSRFRAIALRRTTRTPFLHDPIEGVVLERLRAAASMYAVGCNLITSERQRRELAALVGRGDRAQFGDQRFRRELALWTHTRRALSSDGIAAVGRTTPDVSTPGEAGTTCGAERAGGAACREEQIVHGAPVLGLLHTEADTAAAWLRAGRALAGMLLSATSGAIRSSFLNQPIEVDALRPELARTAGISGYPQLLLRLGYGPLVERTVRRPVEDVLMNS